MDTLSDRDFQALRSRDARFDGRFFIGVVTTGIYCRPVCPAPPARRANLRRFPCAAAAQAAGFRPCRRCRPETAPGTPAWAGTSGTVSRALRLIADGAMDRSDVDHLAARLGVGSRHLRRLFEKHLGASPVAIAQSRRVGFARALIDQTGLPMAQIAFASGFSSVKRFNTAIRATFDRTPTELRRHAAGHAAPNGRGIVLRLAYRPPYAWDEMLEYLAVRATPGVEQVKDGAYRRSALVDGAPVVVEVRPEPNRNQVVVRLDAPVRRGLMESVARVRHLFDLGADPLRISEHLARDPRLRRSVRARPGLRVPGAWDAFELAVRAVLGQQVSVKGAATLAGRLARKYGTRIDGAGRGGITHLFPRPEQLVRGRVETIGMPAERGRAVRALARAVRSGTVALARGESADEVLRALVAIRGIGDWTAQYVALRALGEPDAFLPGDLGVRRALVDADGRLPTARRAEARAARWRPWRGYAVLHLWLESSNGKETA